MRSNPVKENHIDSAVSEILRMPDIFTRPCVMDHAKPYLSLYRVVSLLKSMFEILGNTGTQSLTSKFIRWLTYYGRALLINFSWFQTILVFKFFNQ